MDQSKEETTAATVVSKESLLGKRNFAVACELYQLIEERDFDSIKEISQTIYAIAINRKANGTS